MTAPTRVAGPATRTRARTPLPTRERSTAKPAAQPDRSGTARSRSAAAERAYTRRIQRTRRMTGAAAAAQPGSAYRVSFVVLVIGLLVAGVVATLWFSTQATADSYRLEQAKKDTIALSEQVDQLQRDVARAESPPSLAARAAALGMVPAGDPAHLVAGSDGTITVIGQPSAARATAAPAPAPTQPPTQPSTQLSTPPSTPVSAPSTGGDQIANTPPHVGG